MKNKMVALIAGIICATALFDGIVLTLHEHHEVSALFYTIAFWTGIITYTLATEKQPKSS